MILSYSLGFIFFKTRKTAGTSLEVALSRHCGPRDIITPITVEDEAIRLEKGGRLAQNFSESPGEEERYRESIRKGTLELFPPRKRTFRNHMPAAEVRALVPGDVWSGSYKFTIERHPYEKAVSWAYFRYNRLIGSGPIGGLVSRTKRYFRHRGFKSFLDAEVSDGAYRNWPIYMEGDTLLVDKVYRFEDLPECLEDLAERFTLDLSRSLPRTKHKFRTDRTPAAEVLSRSQKNMVYEHCAREFELMGYER